MITYQQIFKIYHTLNKMYISQEFFFFYSDAKDNDMSVFVGHLRNDYFMRYE